MSRLYSIFVHCLFLPCTLLVLTLLAPTCAAQFVVTDNFNRADGPVGLGWSPWGNGAQISSSRLETFGEANVAGGAYRQLGVTFPLKFSFNFSTAAPSDGGWQIGFNAATTIQPISSSSTSEFAVAQFRGSGAICVTFQISGGVGTQCGNTVSGQRDFTATALITATVNADFSTKITIKYNDGLSPASVTLRTPAPAGALTTPQGSIFLLGNVNATDGPHYFDNFKLTLM